MDLAEAIVTGHGPMNHAVSLDDLKSTLAGVRRQLDDKQRRLETVVKSNLEALRWFEAQTRAITQGHEHLRAEAQCLIDLPPLRPDSFSIPLVSEMPDRETFRAQQVRLRILEAVKQLAVSKEYEMEKVSDSRGSSVAMISRKAKKLADMLQGVPSNLIVEASGSFLELVQSSMRPQLEQLPHFAALFHNDAHWIAAFVSSTVPSVDPLLIQRWSQLGSAMLSHHVQKQSKELSDDLKDPEDIEKAVAKALMRIGQLARVWAAPLLDPALFARTMLAFEAIVLRSFYAHLTHLDYITDAVIARSKRLAASILRAQDTSDELSPLRRRIRAYVDAMDMSLMQLTNRFRRGAFKGTISAQECHGLIEALFEDSPSRRACLEELEEDFQA